MAASDEMFVEAVRRAYEKMRTEMKGEDREAYVMDEKSREAIDSVLDASTRYSRFKSRPASATEIEARRREALELEARLIRERATRDKEESRRRAEAEIARARRAEEEKARAEEEKARKERERYSAFGEGQETVHTRLEVALLSVDPSKACVILRAAMSKDVRNLLLAKFEPTKRIRWNEKDCVWELHPKILPQLKEFLKANFKDVQVIGVQKTVQATKFDQLIGKLDKDDKDRIYKLLALKYHPDRGGDKDTMTLVNSVFKGG